MNNDKVTEEGDERRIELTRVEKVVTGIGILEREEKRAPLQKEFL